MLPGSTLELYWDYEVENTLEPSLSISYTGNSALFFSPSPSQYNFSVSHRTYSQDADTYMTTTTKIRGLVALAAYLDLRCEAAGKWRMATIVDREEMIVYELSSKGRGVVSSRGGHGFMDFGMFAPRENLGRTHGELLTVWKNMI